MARNRHTGHTGIVLIRERKRKRISHEEKVRQLSQYKRVSDPTNRASVNKQWQQIKSFPLYLERKADSETRAALKRRGFFVTQKGVIVDGPRDTRRKPIKGARVSFTKDGIVKWSLKDRRDYIVGMTRKDKLEFAQDPKAFIAKKEKELRERFPDIGRRKIQVRLQWGAYQATKDFSAKQFVQSTTWEAFIQALKEGAKSKDKLTGLHFVVHHGRKSGAALAGVHFTVKGKRGKKRKS